MAEITRTRIRELRSDRPRSMSTRQWGALIGGGALAIYGISRRSALGAALAAGGGALAIVGANQKTSRTPSTSTSLLVTCTPQECYCFWRDFENLPRFMKRLRSVNVIDDRRSNWSAIGPMGKTIEWDTKSQRNVRTNTSPGALCPAQTFRLTDTSNSARPLPTA